MEILFKSKQNSVAFLNFISNFTVMLFHLLKLCFLIVRYMFVALHSIFLMCAIYTVYKDDIALSHFIYKMCEYICLTPRSE